MPEEEERTNEIILMSTSGQNQSMGLGRKMVDNDSKEFLKHLQNSLKPLLKKKKKEYRIR
jgi:hypothetical protein